MTINVYVSLAVDRQTQQFLREIVQVYTPADLVALAELKSKLDQVESQSPPNSTPSTESKP